MSSAHLAEAIITAYSNVGEIVYDPFAGSGSTILAAERTGRICFAMELESEYATIAIERLRAAKRSPSIASDLITFSQT
jgi:DNA modification methylase